LHYLEGIASGLGWRPNLSSIHISSLWSTFTPGHEERQIWIEYSYCGAQTWA